MKKILLASFLLILLTGCSSINRNVYSLEGAQEFSGKSPSSSGDVDILAPGEWYLHKSKVQADAYVCSQELVYGSNWELQSGSYNTYLDCKKAISDLVKK
jgi:uncharacterized lipoprotein YmbA